MLMALPLVGLILVLCGAWYLVARILRFSFLTRLNETRPGLALLAAVGCLVPAALFYLINVETFVVVFLHLVIFFLLCDGVGALINRLRRKKPARYTAGYVAVALTVLVLGAGWFFAHHIYETDYTFKTDKSLPDGGLRVVAISDSHLGLTLDGQDFAKLCDRVNALSPDAVVLVGDFVDDDTKKADMLRAARALGELETTCGVYFVYGNHDNGYFNYRDFSPDELRDALTSNGVTILEDRRVLLGGSVWLVGRQDRSVPDRAEAADLTAGLDGSDYVILLDHQPNDYDSEALCGADLVLSGHTHGGHIFPLGPLSLVLGINDNVYGVQERGDTVFLVTSGVSGWAVPFKTCAVSEFAVIDITH